MKHLGKEWNEMTKSEKGKYEEISQKGTKTSLIYR